MTEPPATWPAPARTPDLVPARMLTEYVYCPRLGYLMWADCEFASNVYVEEGRYHHRRVDETDHTLDPPDADAPPFRTRSVWLSAPSEGLTAKIDLLEVEGARAVPVDTKRSQAPRTGAHEPYCIQLGAQALILRANGYTCTNGVLYYAGSRTRVDVPIDDDLVARTRAHLAAFKRALQQPTPPPPLERSPKCWGCSLVGICLPDELNHIARPRADAPVRQLHPARDHAVPVYVQQQGGKIGVHGEELIVTLGKEVQARAKLFETSSVSIFGNVQITTQALHTLLERDIPVTYYSYGGWFYGSAQAGMHKNVHLRMHQYRAAADPARALALARRFVCAKIRNCRTMLRRNGSCSPQVLNALNQAAQDALAAPDQATLLGIEGNAARHYFGAFSTMLKVRGDRWDFDFSGRNRRPPKDPINALLSFAYSLLAKDLRIAAQIVGFDPYLGFYHQPRYGRPSLALDLMEEFRPLIADSVVITAVNTQQVQSGDFVGSTLGTTLTSSGRKSFIGAYERRMDQLVRHPVFGYQISYRRVLEVQVRLLARHLSGEIDEYPMFLTR